MLVTFVLPVMANIAFAGGILWTISAYGFLKGERWAFPFALYGSVLCILGSFFPVLPYASSGLGFPPTIVIFAFNLLFFIILQWKVHPTPRKVLALSLITGIAYILAFINGVASTHYIIMGGGSYYIALEPLNFLASIVWGLATISLVLGKSGTRLMVYGAALAAIFGGVPIAIASQMELNYPSLFWPSPIVAFFVIILYSKITN